MTGKKTVIKILQGSVVTQTVLGGLIILENVRIADGSACGSEYFRSAD